MSYLQKHSKQDFTIFDLQSSKPSPKVHRKTKTFYFYFAIFLWLYLFGEKLREKKGFGSWERMRNLRALPLRYGKNLNRQSLRPSQFRKLYQSSSREGVEEEEGGRGGRWENGLTTLLPCDLENLLSSLLFVFPFSLIFFFAIDFRIKY